MFKGYTEKLRFEKYFNLWNVNNSECQKYLLSNKLFAKNVSVSRISHEIVQKISRRGKLFNDSSNIEERK